MSYVALYRKFRPTTFDEVRGQDAIVTTLKNQVRNGRVQHAYLFCGTRGTGKTSVAKILARAVNCEDPKDGNPCGACPTCRNIASGTSMNVIEIDAASNNGVDNVREIIDEVQYRPPSGRYKVYIIDEVHMLSAGAFNALLKTLEEPPEYVIFILATTEAAKIPLTILSRCQRYDFHRIDSNTITERLAELTEKEGHKAENKALRYIARAADGSMRDALSLLDQCLAFFSGQTLTYENVLNVLGAVDTAVYRTMLTALTAGDASSALTVFQEALDNGREIGQFITDFIWYLRNLMLVKGSGRDVPVDVSDEQMAELKETAKQISDETLMRDIRVLSELTNQIRYAGNRRVLTEIALIRLTKPQMEKTDDALVERIRLLEERLEELERLGVTAFSAQAPSYAMPPGGNDGNRPFGSFEGNSFTEDPGIPKEVPYAAPEDLQAVKRDWPYILKETLKRHPSEAKLTERFGHLKFDPQETRPKLFIEYEDDVAHRCVADEEFRTALRTAVRRRYEKDIDIELILKKDSRLPLQSVTVDEQLKKINIPVEIVRDSDQQ